MTVSVAVRLGLEGGQAATRGVEDFGRKGSASLREMKRAAQELPPHLVAVSRGVGAIKDSVDGLAARSGVLGDLAGSFGGYGVAVAAAAAGVVAVGMALNRAVRDAAAFGDEIGDTANKLRVTTDYLQEMRYAAHALGGEYKDADTALEGFTQIFGAAQSGLSSKAIKPFAALGLDPKSFSSVQEALDAVIGKISSLGSAAQQAAVADKLGLTPLLPAIREGAGSIDELRKSAHDLGYVMDRDLIAKAGEANDKFEDLQAILDVQFKSAMVDAIPLVMQLSQLMADAAKSAGWLATKAEAVGKAWAFVGSLDPFAQADAQEAKTYEAERAKRFEDAKADPVVKGGFSMAAFRAAFRKPAPASPNGELVDLEEQRKREEAAKKAAADAERERKRRLDAQERTTSAIAAADARELAAQRTYAGTLEDMLDVELKALDEAEARRLKQIDIDAREGKLDATKVDELKRAEQDAFAAEREVARRKAYEDTANRRLADEKRLAQTTGEILSLASAGARTAEERRRIETELLDLQQSLVRKETQRDLDRRTDLSDDDRAKILSTQDRLFSAQRTALNRDTMGPLEAYRDSLIRTNGEIRESFEQLAVDGFKTLNDGLVSVILTSGTLGDTFGRITDMIVEGLARVVYQVAIIGPMLDALGKASSGGGLLGKLAGAAAGALGGSFGSSFASSNVSAASASDLGGANLVSQLMGKGRATGGPVYRGDVRPIDEYGIERFARFSGDGYVNDAARTAAEIRDQAIAARSTYGANAAGGGEVAVALNNNSPMPLQATARESRDNMGNRKVEIDLTELIDSRVAKGNRELFGGEFDGPFQRNFGVRRRLTGG